MKTGRGSGSGHPETTHRFAGAFPVRFQIMFGLALGVVLPAVIAAALLGTPLAEANLFQTMIGTALSLVAGYAAFRRLHVFPGITAGGYVVACLTGSFCVLIVTMLLLRIDYSRVQLTLSYVISIAFFTFVHLRFEARRRRLIGVVPGGATANLPVALKVDWLLLESPNQQMPALDAVVADLRYDHSKPWDERIAGFALEGIPVFHIKQAIEQLTGKVELEHLSENTLGSLNPNDIYLKIKSFLDAVAALVLLVILAPVLALIAVMIRIDSAGPALFRQRRIGFRSIPFTVYKFRTMQNTAPPQGDQDARLSAITQANDVRITRLGGFLRRTRLDELPQLINVLRGEMSLIGPRPEAEALSAWYSSEISFYCYRHIIKPGLTGWAQVNQGHVADVEDVREKLHLDFYYVKNFSIWLDILIVLRTLRTMVTGHGSR